MEKNTTSPLTTENSVLTIDGHNIAVSRLRPVDAGQGDRPVLVFLHEGLGSMRLWGDFPHQIALACGLEALLYDRLGHGLSDPLPSGAPDAAYLEPEAWRFLPQVLSNCCIRRPILIGHSDGGTIALMYAARLGQDVLGIITEAAHVCVEDLTREGIRKAVALYRRGDLKAKLHQYHGDKIEKLFLRWADTWLSEDFRAWTIEPLLPAVRCPVLAIQGAADEYGTPDQMRTIAAKVSGRGESFLVPDCRHSPHQQARAPVTERMLRFIDAVARDAGA